MFSHAPHPGISYPLTTLEPPGFVTRDIHMTPWSGQNLKLPPIQELQKIVQQRSIEASSTYHSSPSPGHLNTSPRPSTHSQNSSLYYIVFQQGRTHNEKFDPLDLKLDHFTAGQSIEGMDGVCRFGSGNFRVMMNMFAEHHNVDTTRKCRGERFIYDQRCARDATTSTTGLMVSTANSSNVPAATDFSEQRDMYEHQAPQTSTFHRQVNQEPMNAQQPSTPPSRICNEKMRKLALRRERSFSPKDDYNIMRGWSRYLYGWSRYSADPSLHLSHKSSAQIRDRFRTRWPSSYNDCTIPIRLPAGGFPAQQRLRTRELEFEIFTKFHMEAGNVIRTSSGEFMSPEEYRQSTPPRQVNMTDLPSNEWTNDRVGYMETSQDRSISPVSPTSLSESGWSFMSSAPVSAMGLPVHSPPATSFSTETSLGSPSTSRPSPQISLPNYISVSKIGSSMDLDDTRLAPISLERRSPTRW